MASPYCLTCGQPLAPGVGACPVCGRLVSGAGLPPPAGVGPVAGPLPGAPDAPPPPPGWSPPPPPPPSVLPAAEISFETLLGLRGIRQFLVQRAMLPARAEYRVMDLEKRVLFLVARNVAMDFRAHLKGNMDLTYSLEDPRGVLLGTFTTSFGQGWSGRGSLTFTLTDLIGRPSLSIALHRGATGGITATAAFPDGRPMMQVQGNAIRHNFVIQDPAGGELARVHEDWVSVRDTYGLEIVGAIDPLYPIAFAILLEFEKTGR